MQMVKKKDPEFTFRINLHPIQVRIHSQHSLQDKSHCSRPFQTGLLLSTYSNCSNQHSRFVLSSLESTTVVRTNFGSQMYSKRKKKQINSEVIVRNVFSTIIKSHPSRPGLRSTPLLFFSDNLRSDVRKVWDFHQEQVFWS